MMLSIGGGAGRRIMEGFTEFEEDIHFDDDDPDFDHHEDEHHHHHPVPVPAISVPIFITEKNNPNVYKWLAILLDQRNRFKGLEARVKSFPAIKKHLLRAVELNPHDVISYYILGKLCYELSRMSRLQRFITRVFYGQVPTCSYEEAYDYLVKANEVQPDCYYIPSVYTLGELCISMRQYYKAGYYLNLATRLPARNQLEETYVARSGALLKRLQTYAIPYQVRLFDNFDF